MTIELMYLHCWKQERVEAERKKQPKVCLTSQRVHDYIVGCDICKMIVPRMETLEMRWTFPWKAVLVYFFLDR